MQIVLKLTQKLPQLKTISFHLKLKQISLLPTSNPVKIVKFHLPNLHFLPSVNMFPHSPFSFVILILRQISEVVNLCASCLDGPQPSASSWLPSGHQTALMEENMWGMSNPDSSAAISVLTLASMRRNREPKSRNRQVKVDFLTPQSQNKVSHQSVCNC